MKSAIILSLLTTFLGITFNITPNIPALMTAVICVMGLDFITGVIKAKFKKIERTSEGYRRTVMKVTQYFTAIALSLGLKYLVSIVAKEANDKMIYVSMAVFLFIIYIEITSILENLNEIDNRSPFAKFLVRPLLKIMKFGLEKNPVTQAAEKIEAEQKGSSSNLPVVILVIACSVLFSACISERKAEQITNDFNTRHPDKQAKACMDKFPPKVGETKPGKPILQKQEVIKDTAAEAAYLKQIDELTKALIAEQMMNSGSTPIDTAALRDIILRSITKPPAEVRNFYYTKTDTIPVADSAAITYWKLQFEASQKKLQQTEIQRDDYKAKLSKRTKQALTLGGILLLILIYTGYRIYKRFNPASKWL